MIVGSLSRSLLIEHSSSLPTCASSSTGCLVAHRTPFRVKSVDHSFIVLTLRRPGLAIRTLKISTSRVMNRPVAKRRCFSKSPSLCVRLGTIPCLSGDRPFVFKDMRTVFTSFAVFFRLIVCFRLHAHSLAKNTGGGGARESEKLDHYFNISTLEAILNVAKNRAIWFTAPDMLGAATARHRWRTICSTNMQGT
jgi:hypothetical protein